MKRIGVVTYPEDRLSGISHTLREQQAGFITTKLFRFKHSFVASRLFVDATVEPGGGIRIEAIDPRSGGAFEGLSLEASSSIPAPGGGKVQATWRGGQSLGHLRELQLRIELRGATVFGVEFE